MLIEEKRYCNLCHGIIVHGQKHVQMRLAGSGGTSRFQCTHFHHRFKGDCWDRQRRNQTGQASEQSRAEISSAASSR